MNLDSRILVKLLPSMLVAALAIGCGDDDGESSSDSAPSTTADGGGLQADGGASAEGGLDASSSTAVDGARPGSSDAGVAAEAGASSDGGASGEGVVAEAGASSDGGASGESDGAVTDIDASAVDGSSVGSVDGAVSESDAAVTGSDAAVIVDATVADGGEPVVFTDDAIVGFLQAANQHEIVAGELAQERSSNPQVDAYAADMVAVHAAAKDTWADFAIAQGIREGGSQQEDLFRERQLQVMRELDDESGPAFDALYIQSQAVAHSELLATIDTILLPSASEALREPLSQLRQAVAEHLQRATDIGLALMDATAP